MAQQLKDLAVTTLTQVTAVARVWSLAPELMHAVSTAPEGKHFFLIKNNKIDKQKVW